MIDVQWVLVSIRDKCHGEQKLPYVFVPIILLQHGYCTFVIIILDLLLGCSST